MVLEARLKSLADIEDLRKLTQSLAMLDAIMSPEWEHRYYSFNSKWGEGEMMASMRNGSGDEYFILFDSHGAIMKGFDHESAMSPWSAEEEKVWPGMFDGVPVEFETFLAEPAFSIPETTFCIWRRYVDTAWHVGPINYPDEDDPDGSEYLLSILDGRPSTYKEFAESYYEKKRYAKKRGLKKVQWIVHALNCAEPNLKLRRVMERRGFQVVDIEGVGKAYYQINEIG